MKEKMNESGRGKRETEREMGRACDLIAHATADIKFCLLRVMRMSVSTKL